MIMHSNILRQVPYLVSVITDEITMSIIDRPNNHLLGGYYTDVLAPIHSPPPAGAI
jgi:hypothetical protein